MTQETRTAKTGTGFLGHLASLGGGSSATSGAGLLGHLDSLGGGSSAIGSASAPAVMGYLDALRSGTAAAPSAPAVQNYIESVSSGAAVEDSPGAGILSYLSTIPSTNTQTSGAGIASYIGAFPSSPGRIGGPGFATYLGSISQECDTVQPTEQCAEAITEYFGALSSGDVSPTTVR